MAEAATLESIASSLAAVQDRLAKLEKWPSHSHSVRRCRGKRRPSRLHSLKVARAMDNRVIRTPKAMRAMGD